MPRHCALPSPLQAFLDTLNAQFVSPLAYLKALHPAEWSNFCERLGVLPGAVIRGTGTEADGMGGAAGGGRIGIGDDAVWAATHDAAGVPTDGAWEVRVWASKRGQTLGRTVDGVMEYAAAYRTLVQAEITVRAVMDEVAAGKLSPHVTQAGSGATVALPQGAAGRGGTSQVMTAGSSAAAMALQPRYASGPDSAARAQARSRGGQASRVAAVGVQGTPLTPLPYIAESAVVLADWLTTQKVSYVCCNQMYAAAGGEFVQNRTDVDRLLAAHPLLSSVYWDESQPPGGGTGRSSIVSVHIDGMRGVRYRVPQPGNAIKDGIAEGKPANTDNAVPFLRGLFIQQLDMNQAFYASEALKLPNLLREFEVPRPRRGKRHRTSDTSGAAAGSGADTADTDAGVAGNSQAAATYGGSRPNALTRDVALVGMREHIFTQGLSTR